MNNCIIFLFRAVGATWCLLTIIIYCYELVTTKNIIHSFTICILCRTQHHAMLPRPQGGDYEFKLAFEIIPRWERGMGQSKHILMPAANWDLTLTPGWQNENRELMRGNWSSNGVTDNSNSSYNQCFLLLCNLQLCFVKIILFCLWCWELEPNAASLGVCFTF